MREEARIDRITDLINKLWKMSPDQRLGQLLINAGIVEDGFRTWNHEDDRIEERLEKVIEENTFKRMEDGEDDND